MSNEDKVIIEKAMVAADLDWSSHKEVMIMLVDLKSSDKSAVKADFEKYFSLAEEFTGSNGLKLQSALLEVRSRIYQNMAKTLPGTKRRAVWESYLEENKKKTKEFNEKQDKLKAEILEVEKRIKARYQ